MKSVIAASVLALMASTSAFATDVDADISQFAIGIQEALNDIEDVTKVKVGVQEAVNAANLVSKASAGNLDTILQKSAVEQDAENSIESGYSWDWNWKKHKWEMERDYVTIDDVTQSATNVANSVSLGDDDVPGTANVLDWIKQGAFVDQYATNDIAVADTVLDVSQTAVNASNLIMVDLDAPDLDKIEQVAVGDQDALNTIQFKKWIDGNATVDGDVVPSTQDATNVINSVSVKSVNYTLAQFSAVDQKARNVADSVGSNSKIWDFEQTAVNATNLVSIDEIDVGLGISQVAFVSQNASNLIDANGTVEAVVQSATNVANSIGDMN